MLYKSVSVYKKKSTFNFTGSFIENVYEMLYADKP